MNVNSFTDRLYVHYINATKRKVKEEAEFFSRLSNLMQEGYLFADSISILLPHHVEAYEDVQQLVDDKLRQGAGVTGVLEALQLSSPYLVAISIAEKNGHMIEALQGVAKQMALAEATKKKIQKLLVYPVALIIFLLILFLVFRTFFFPNIENMVISRGNGGGESSLALSNGLLHVPDALVISGIMIICIVVFFKFFVKRQPVSKQLNILLKIPLLRGYTKLSMTKDFSKHLGSLLQSGFSLQASLQILEEQQLQPFVQYFSILVKERVIYGDTLAQAISWMSIWQKDFPTFVEHGERSGYLGKELMLYSELLDEKQEQLLQRMIALLQPTFFIVIALCIVAAYLSLLLPIYKMIDLV
ncbi:chromosome partitioning protein ParA [Lysinibacillus contaminans]|uniref:Chromosome partitioning protein ParA n=1 Tax=Lysinibacillus contaminans TaxID=1293441 RepID=A0ABR5JZI0_9BACI|nr:competence type IV pilus assembly protein ComGB [Lysinibacillus contaminans]KOS68072.1 chromosome partitioning protein ParA [Lysinibacillus contaminans]